jgi:hypothetical protein
MFKVGDKVRYYRNREEGTDKGRSELLGQVFTISKLQETNRFGATCFVYFKEVKGYWWDISEICELTPLDELL